MHPLTTLSAIEEFSLDLTEWSNRSRSTRFFIMNERINYRAKWLRKGIDCCCRLCGGQVLKCSYDIFYVKRK
jgi:hypothetical protein